MSKIRKLLTPRVTMGLFALALILLLLSSISGTRAALTYISDDYTAAMELRHIGVALLENGQRVSGEDWGSSSGTAAAGELLNHIPRGKDFHPNQAYPEELSVRNEGTIGQYVRVTVYRYWTDAEGHKLTNLNPDFIHLDFQENGDWHIDSQTTERTVLYYQHLLPAGETAVSPFTTTLIVDGEINNVYSSTQEDGRITYTYDYDGAYFCVEAVVDAVQEHNAGAAMMSAWGVDPGIA